MTIDEAIEKYKEITNTDTICSAYCDMFCDKCVQESRQLIEWLEELKKLRQCTNIENREYPYFNGFKEGKQVGYNKAIDDLVKGANEMAIEVDTGTYTMKAIGIGLLEHIAEQLKAGVNNDKSI